LLYVNIYFLFSISNEENNRRCGGGQPMNGPHAPGVVANAYAGSSLFTSPQSCASVTSFV